MEPSLTAGDTRKRRVDQIVTDGDIDKAYRFTVLLPNGTSVGITIRDPDSLMPFGDFMRMVKERYIRAEAQDPSLKSKRHVPWESDELYLEDASGNQIKSKIVFDSFKPQKRHILHLHDGSCDTTDTFENMWDLTPDTDLLEELPEEYTFENALADLIDNSLQAVWANPRKSKRLISLDISDEKISIFDTGPGMDESDENCIAKWGKMGASRHRKFKARAVGGKPPYLMPFFGLFGYGGPIASMHLGRHAVVSSKTVKSKRVYMLHLKREALLRRSGSQHSWRTDGGVRVPLENEIARAPQGSFTKVEIFKPRIKKVNLYQLLCKLKDIYFPYVQYDGLSNLRRTIRPVHFEVNGIDLAEIEGGEVAITNLHSCNGPDFIIQVHFSITQDTDANIILDSAAIHEANARLKCVYFPIVQGKENIERILEKLEADGCRVAETYESFSRVSIRRLGRLLPDARWGVLPFMEERHKKGDKAHLFRRSFFRVKCFIETDAGFSTTTSKTDLAQHSPFTGALKKIGRPLYGVKEIKVQIYREGKLLAPSQLEEEYCDWIIQMHERYDEEVDSSEDQAIFIINPGNKKALGVSSDVVRVHRRMTRKGVSWRCGQKVKILKGACAGVHKTNVYATLEYFLLEGLQGDGGGEARIICRPLGVLDEKGCILSKHDGNVRLEVQSSVSIPIGVIDSGELVAVGISEWVCQMEKHHLKAPSSIDLLDANQCEELGFHVALPVHAPIPAGQEPPKEIVAVVRPENFSYSTAPENLDQKYIVKSRMEMSMEVKFSGDADNGQESHLCSSHVTPSSQRGFHGLYIFSLQHKSHELFQKSGVYKFLFHMDETSCKNCEKEVTVHASAEVGRWQLLGYDQNKHLRVRVGSCVTPLDVACYDRYGNLMPFPSTPKVNLQFKMGKGTLIYVKKMKAGLLADKKTLRIKNLLIESGDLDIIRPSYEGTVLLCPLDESLSISIPCQVIPGHARRVLAHPSMQSIQMLPGYIVQELKLELFDAYGNHALKGSEVLLKVEGFSIEDQMGKKHKVDDDGFVHLGGMLKVTVGYGQDVSLSVIAGGEEIFKEESQTEKRELRVVEPAPQLCAAGSQLENFVFEIVDLEGNLDEDIHDDEKNGHFHRLSIKVDSSITKSTTVYAFQKGRCTVPSLAVPQDAGCFSFTAVHSHYGELSLSIEIGIQPSSDLHEIQTLCSNRNIMMLVDKSTANDVENVLSIIKNGKVLEDDILETGLRIVHQEKVLKLLHARKVEMDQSLMELGEPSPLNIMDCFFTKEEMIDTIESRDGSAASVLCKLIRNFPSEGPHRRPRDCIIGVVALGTICNIELSRILAKYLGEDQMLGIVCTNSEVAFSRQMYNKNGEVDLQNAVYAKAAELGKSISGEFHVICLEEISPPMASSPSPTLWTSPAIVSNSGLEDHGAGQHGHIGTSSNTQPLEDIAGSVDPIIPMSGQVYHGQNIGTPSSAEQSQNDGNTATPTDPRKLIEPYGDSFKDATRVVRDLNKIVNNHWRGSYTRYTSAPDDVKELWWKEFTRHFRWAESDETEVRRIFNKKVGDHMRNVMNKAKTRQARPLYISIDHWMEMMRIWGTEEHKQASERNKKNRASTSSQGGATYAGGSINIGEHKRRISEELGREPTYSQTFECTFIKKDKTYVSDRARAIKEKFDELAMGNSSGGDGTGVSADQSALWVKASGGVKRGKIFGLGSLAKECARKVGASSSASRSRSRPDAHVYEEVRHLKELLVRKDEKIDAMAKKMERIFRHLQMDDIEEDDVPPTDRTGHEEHGDGGAGHDDDNDGTATPLST